MAHLHHFCTTVPTDRYSDSRPQFSLYADTEGLYAAEIVLPTSIDPSLRFACSSQTWRSQTEARKDAAFQAYLHLYRAGLVNDNLLPLIKDFEDKYELQDQDSGVSVVSVLSEIDPWQEVSDKFRYESCLTEWNRAAASLRYNGVEYVKCFFLLPVDIVPIHGLHLYLNASSCLEFVLVPIGSQKCKNTEVAVAKRSTLAILRSVYGSRIAKEEENFLLHILATESIAIKRCKATDVYQRLKGQSDLKLRETIGLVHDNRRHGVKWVFGGFRWGHEVDPEWARRYKGKIDSTELYIRATRLSRQRDFLNPLSSKGRHSIAHACRELLRAEDCLIDNVPLPYTILAYLIPAITYRLQGTMLASLLYRNISPAVQTSSLELILTAITASSASDTMNYQRIEFLGDCILKFCTSLQLMAQRESWPESYLTAAKEKLISNRSLTKVSISHAFSRFIVTKGIKFAKWRPQLVRKFCTPTSTGERNLRSAKVQADVVEALIGASFVEGGMANALTLLKHLIPQNGWYEHDNAVAKLYGLVPKGFIQYLQDNKLEDLLGYSFNRKLLLKEALTHASFSSHRELCNLSYERLEFLGDAVLDQIISDIIFSHRPSLSHSEMHSIRTAVVSTAFLAFVCLEYTRTEQIFQCPKQSQKRMEKLDVRRRIWQFMRHASTEIPFAQIETLKKHEEFRSAILTALEKDKRYPWHLLSRVRASKFFADLIESILGAIYIDSSGNLSTCLSFLERLGIITYLQRVLHMRIDCLHPKERLGILARSQKVRYHHQKYGQQYRCWAYLDEAMLGTYVESTTILDAEVNVAWAASELLERDIKV